MFHISAKTDYGLLIMLALAERYEHSPVSLRQIALEKRLPYKFLSQVVIPLRKSGLLTAQEGARGGYQLSRTPEQINVGEIIRALEGGNFSVVRCIKQGTEACPGGILCTLPPFWSTIAHQLNKTFSSTTLADLLAQPSQLSASQ